VRDDAGSRDGRTTAVDMRLCRMRLTIAELMAAVVYAAVLIWLLGDGHAVPSVGMAWFAVAFVCWASVRGRRRPAAICFGASVIAANSSVAPLCVYYQGWALTVLYIGLLGGMPMIFGFGAAWAGVAMHREIDRGRSPSASWPPLLAIVLALSIAMTPLMTLLTLWPLRAAFLISRPALERLADQVAAGKSPPFPIRAGLFRIVRSATDPVNGNVALITDPKPSGRVGFVRSKPGTPHGPLSSLFMGMSLSQTWAFEMED
jgi:hypothetical protein